MSEQEYKIKTWEEIYEDMISLVFSKPIKATDSNNGSVLCSILEAVSRVIAEGYLHCKAGFTKYLEELPESAFGLKKLEGSKAKGHVVFHTEEIEENGKKVYRKAEGNISIPSRIEIASGSVIFETAEAGEILKGETQSKPILAVAKEIGEKGNVAIGAITNIVSNHNSQIHSVKNYEAFGSGRVAETDAMFKRRFVHYLRGLQKTNTDGIVEAASSAGAHYVNVVTYVPPKQILTNTTADNIFQFEIAEEGKELKEEIGKENRKQHLANCIVYVANRNGECPASLIQDVKEKIEGKGIAENPGYRPCGVQIAVLPISTRRVFQATSLLIIARSTFPDKEVATRRITEQILKFFSNFKVGQNLVITDLIVAIRMLEWVKDVKIRQNSNPSEELNSPKIEDGELLIVKKEDIKVDLDWYKK